MGFSFVIGNAKGQWMIGKEHSEETRKKQSDALMGHEVSKEARQKLSSFRTGIKLSEEHKLAIGKGGLGKKRSIEFSQNLSKRMTGIPKSESHKQHLSKSKMGVPNEKLKGRKHSEEWTRKNREANIGKHAGDKNPAWKGGKSFEEYPQEWTDDLKNSIRKRDNFICQLCGKSQQKNGKKLDVHHINYIKTDLNPNNLISLCVSCHTKTGSNRNHWEMLLSEMNQKNLRLISNSRC